MITEIKPKKNKIPQDNIITLQVHPEVKAKIRLNHRRPFRSYSKTPSSSKTKSYFLEPELHLQNFQESSPKLMTYRELLSERKTQKPRLSSYQLYKQEQKNNKMLYKQRGGEWNRRLWSKRSDRGESRSFIRSKSYVQHPKKAEDTVKERLVNTINSFKLMTISKTISQSPRSRSMYIKTNDGKRKTIDNKKYLQKLKFELQTNPFSTVITPRTGIKTLEPAVLALSPKSKENNTKNDANQRRSDPIKKRSEGQRQGKGAFNEQTCRPWSGTYNEFGLDCPIFLNNN